MSPPSERWHAAYAMLPAGLARDVTFTVADGRFAQVRSGAAPGDARRLPGITLPGFANAHSHAFHRALRGRTHDGAGTFWTWRERMYAVAAQLDPDSYLALATAAYAEMALAGITTVGEFHYLHHDRGGQPYTTPDAMGQALRQAASAAGIRLTLLDTCYLAGGLTGAGHTPLAPRQARFADASVDAWAERATSARDGAGFRPGFALHSVRAVPRDDIPAVVAAAADRPLHVHLSEQPAENAACQRFYGQTPTQLLAAQGALGPWTTAVHATHLTEPDVLALGAARVTACICPTTERDLADGIGPARALSRAGARLSLGSDQHAVVDPFEEARGLETHERLRSLRRGRFGQDELLAAATAHASLGWPDAGQLAAGGRADLVAVRLDSVRTAGVDPAQVLMAATAADVDTVVVGGRVVVDGGRHRLGDVPSLLRHAIQPLWEQR